MILEMKVFRAKKIILINIMYVTLRGIIIYNIDKEHNSIYLNLAILLSLNKCGIQIKTIIVISKICYKMSKNSMNLFCLRKHSLMKSVNSYHCILLTCYPIILTQIITSKLATTDSSNCPLSKLWLQSNITLNIY